MKQKMKMKIIMNIMKINKNNIMKMIYMIN